MRKGGNSVLNSWAQSVVENEVGRNVLVMLGIGALSLLFGELKFNIPGIEGAISDLRTLIVFIGVLYFSKWYYLIGVSVITAITTQAEGSVIATILMHAVSSVFIYFVYKKLLVKVKSYFHKAIIWAFTIVVVYFIFTLLILVLASYVLGLTESDRIVEIYRMTVYVSRFEIIVTSIISALYFYSFLMRKKLIQSKEELLEAKEKAEESDAIKTAFLQNMSHEIRTPLNTIAGGAHLLIQRTMEEEESKEIEASVSESVDYMVELIDQVLEFSRLETGAYNKTYLGFSIQELYDTVLSSEDIKVKLRMAGERVKFESQIDDSLQARNLQSNVDLIRKVILIIIRNAFKFTNKGFVRVHFKEYAGNSLLIEVEDTGIGIAEKDIPKVFERFYQVDEFQKGVGLSLSFAYRMVTLLKGSISIESELGIGTTVKVILPGLS